MRSVIVLALALMACQSDEEKATSLRTELTIAQLTYQAQGRKCHALYPDATPAHPPSISDPKIRACIDTLIQRQARLDLAERAYNRFMNR